jgi:hypothetical protein
MAANIRTYRNNNRCCELVLVGLFRFDLVAALAGRRLEKQTSLTV